ncbi:unnamed protein product, partial [Mesorhabditis belari]|uniref:Uncharacterized protein n=1 Tax=Mesorhabditis belari TaxID=2138241 RepID=A0AAF3EXE9_9BILA
MRLLLLASLFFASTQADCDANGLDAVRACYKDFLGFYGLDSGALLPPFPTFTLVRDETLRKSGVDYLRKVCENAAQLYQCTTPFATPLYSCLMNMTLDSSGLRFLYAHDQASGQYQCTDGYPTWVKDFDCIAKVKYEYLNELAQCYALYWIELVESADFCTPYADPAGAYNSYMACKAPYYQKGCNGDPNAAAFSCASDRAAFLSDPDGQICEQKGLLHQCPPYR